MTYCWPVHQTGGKQLPEVQQKDKDNNDAWLQILLLEIILITIGEWPTHFTLDFKGRRGGGECGFGKGAGYR